MLNLWSVLLTVRIFEYRGEENTKQSRLCADREIMERIMRGFRLKFPLICRPTRSAHWVVSHYDRFLNDSIAQTRSETYGFWLRWFTMTGPTEGGIVWLTNDFSRQRFVKNFTPVPQLGLSSSQKSGSIQWGSPQPMMATRWFELPVFS